VTEAVFVLGRETSVEDAAAPTESGADARGRSVAARSGKSWRSAPERRMLDVDTAILSIALRLPASRSYFAARLRSEDLGNLSTLSIRQPESR